MEMAVQNRRRLGKKRLEPPATAHLLTFKMNKGALVGAPLCCIWGM